MSQATLKSELLEKAQSAFSPSLRPDETIVAAGFVMVPPAFWAYLLFIANVVKTAQTYLAILTNQRLVLVRTKSWSGQYTPKTIVVKREYERSDVRNAAIEGNGVVLQTTRGRVKLVSIRVIGAVMTPPDFLGMIVEACQSKT